MDIGGFVKAHPIAIAGGVFVVGLGFLILHGSRGTASAGVSGPSDAQIAAAAQMQQTQAQGSFAEAIANLQSQTQISLAQIGAGVATTQSDNTLTATLKAIEAEMNKDALSAGIEKAGLDTQLSMAQISADVTKTQLADQTELQKQQLRNQYDQNAWDYYNTQTALRLSDDTQNRLMQQQFALVNNLLTKLPQAA